MDLLVNEKVQQRYAEGAKERQADLCCPVDYDPHYLKVIPDEVIEKDYGCGDPSRYIGPGDVVLDLGSGGGKICFIASQVVGPEGRVIGVDMTDDMLALARRNAPVVAEKIGYANVEFRKGQIQDMKTNMSLVEEYLQANPVSDTNGYARLQQEIERLRQESPLVADGSVDIIVSNCVLNLVSDQEKRKLFAEMFRVLKPGGRIAISDIVSDKHSPAHLKEDETLWSGCISGAFQEQEFISLLEETGFEAIVIDKYEDDPWQVIEGIEYRSMTVLASKNIESTAGDKQYTVMYKGPWTRVETENGEVFERGQRQVVREKTYMKISGNPYKDQMITISPGSGSKEKTGRGAVETSPSGCC